jgi:hypothetical protein
LPVSKLSYAGQLLETGLDTAQGGLQAMPAGQFETMLNMTDSRSFLNTTLGYGVYQWVASNSTEVYAPDIVSHFNITMDQFSILQTWLRNVSRSEFLANEIFSMLNSGVPRGRQVQKWEDLPYRQWLMGDVIARLQGGKESLVSVTPDAPVEFPFYVNAMKTQKHSTAVNISSDGVSDALLDRLKANVTVRLPVEWDLDSVRCFETVTTIADLTEFVFLILKSRFWHPMTPWFWIPSLA